MKKNKRWYKAKRSKHFWEKFEEPNPNRREYFPDIRFLVEDFNYLQEASFRHNISLSCQFEKILNKFFFNFLINQIPIQNASDKKQRINYKNMLFVRKRRFMIHPSLIQLIKTEAMNRNMEITYFVHQIFNIYRKKYPIFNTAPLFKGKKYLYTLKK